MNKKSYFSPLVWTVEIEPEAVLANSYKDGGDVFSTNWHRNEDDNLRW